MENITTAEPINGQYPEEIPTPEVGPHEAGISRRRFLSALAICPDRFHFEQLLREGGVARVLQDYPMFAMHDVTILKKHWGIKSLRKAPVVKVARTKTITDESFEALAQRLTVRVAEILAEKLLG